MAEQTSIRRIWTSPNYVLFLVGACCNHITNWMQRVGVAWLAWELTGSTAWLGVVAAADLAPMIVLATFAGAVADRSNAARMVRIFQLLFVVQSALLATLTLTQLITIEQLFLLSLMSGIIHPFWLASRQIVMPATVERRDVGTIVAMDSATFQSARFVGPAIAGLLIPVAGVGGVFVAHMIGASLFAMALMAIRVRLPQPVNRGKRRIFGDIADGFRYILGHGGIPYLLLLMAAASVFVRPIQDMLPGLVDQVFDRGAVGLAWITSAMGVGAMISATRIALRGKLTGLTFSALAGGLGVVCATVLLVTAQWFWAAVGAAVLFGYTFNSISTSIQALIHSTVEDSMRGRVVSFYMLVFRGMPAIGALSVGAMAEALGLQVACVVSAGACFLVWLFVAPRYRSMAKATELMLKTD